MSALAVEDLARLATLPYERGAEVLALRLGADTAPGETPIAPYDFADYRARHGASPPLPRYVVSPLVATSGDPMTIEVVFARGAGEETAVVEVPAGTPAGLSFAIPLPDDPAVRLRRIRQRPRALPGPGADGWRLVALLGTLSKLLWVVGREQDELRHHLGDVGRQRLLAFAHGASLDLHGRDLRVPRFPAREHSFDAATVALYHLNEHPVADGGAVADETERFGLAGHPATNAGAVSGSVGKFGRAFRVPGPSGAGRLEIPSHADFDVAAGAGFTVELFARIEATAGAPQALVVKGLLSPAGDPSADGWSLAAGEMRGIPGNVRWSLRSGAVVVSVFADRSLSDGAFHHVAGTVDRASGRARLFVDGEERASAALGALGAVANAEPVLLGRSSTGHQAAAIVDELRVSAVARTDFHPVAGESDEPYRKRLALFERWLLPTGNALLSALNGAVAPIGGDAAPFVLVEKDRPVATAARIARVVPAVLPAGARLDLSGDRLADVDTTCGRAEEDASFHEAFLTRHDDARVVYAGGEGARRMHVVVAQALDDLLARLSAAGGPGLSIVDRAFDPAGEGLHRVGRALELRHQVLLPPALAAFAHRAGFHYVETRTSSVLAAVAAGPQLEVVASPLAPGAQPAAADVFVAGALDLTLRPGSLPAAARVEWTVVRCGFGRGALAPHPDDPPTLKTPLAARRRVRLLAEAAGDVTVSVQCRLGRVTAIGSRTFRVVPSDLADGVRIAADGETGVDEAAAVDPPAPGLDPAYLVSSTLPATFDPGPDTRRMQVALDRRLERLLGMLAPPPAQLRVREAFRPGDPGPAGVGRALLLRHGALAAGPFAALVHQAGFDYVERRGADVYASIASDELIEIVRPDGSPLPEELVVGAPVALELRPKPLPAGGALDWSLDPVGRGSLRLSSTLRPATTATPLDLGLVGLSVLFLGADAQATPPYAFEVRLKPALEAAGAIVPKHEYDLVMNILSFFHPIGVEVQTRRLRERVVEVRDNLLNAFPGYTYPDFRVEPRTARRQ
jgi:hypothetical protein